MLQNSEVSSPIWPRPKSWSQCRSSHRAKTTSEAVKQRNFGSLVISQEVNLLFLTITVICREPVMTHLLRTMWYFPNHFQTYEYVWSRYHSYEVSKPRVNIFNQWESEAQSVQVISPKTNRKPGHFQDKNICVYLLPDLIPDWENSTILCTLSQDSKKRGAAKWSHVLV